MAKEKFVPVNGAYNITSAQKDEFTQFLRNKIKQNNKINILELVLASKLLTSKGEVRRAIKNNGIKINDTTILDDKLIVDFNQYDKNSCKLSFGKKKHIVVKLI